MKRLIIASFFCIFLVVTYAIITTYNRGGIMATNAYGQTYVGSDDFRGWLAAGNYSNPVIASQQYSDPRSLLNYVGNDGQTGSQDPFTRTAAAKAFEEYQAQRQAPAGGGSYDPAAAAAAAEAARKRAANEAARGNTQKAIDSLGTELDVGYKNIDAESGAVRSRYDRESQTNEDDYNTQTVTNNQNLLKNKQNALQAAAQGARGLRSTLASLGALGGTGLTLANRAVTNAANQDLGEASETAATNARTLDTAIGKYRDEDKIRRDELETQARNQRTALEGRVESKRQGYFQKMAELFSEIGDAGNATSFLNRAGDLNNTIAQKTAVAATPIAARGAAFTPGALADYLAGTGDMTVEAVAGDATGLGASPSSILAGGKKEDKRRQQQLVMA